MTNSTDMLILGGGSGGYACAFRAAQLGMSVTLIDENKVGGTCLHRGCIPTKALLHAAEVADSARESEIFGVKATFDGIDMAAVTSYKDDVVSKLYKGLQGLVKNHDINYVEGRGHYVGDKTVVVGEQTYTGRAIVLATGSYPRMLPGLGISERVFTSDQALALEAVPARAVVLGGGVIGVEFASIWASFGAQVTVVEALPRLLAGEDEWSSRQIERAFRKRGIVVKTGSKFAGVQETETGVIVNLETGETIDADVLLIAVGRAPNTTDTGFEDSGVALDRGFVVVDENLRTNHADVYAVGDVVSGPQLAHRGFQHGIFAAEHVAGLSPNRVEESNIPRVTYSNPEVASVGLTESQARDRHGEVSVATYDLAGNGKSQILKTAGGVKVIRSGSEERTGPILGIHMVGARVGDLVGEAQLVVNWEAYAEEVAPLIHAHPTQAEALGEVHLTLAGKPLHSHK
ncbi:dihydrolipoyl dehydrogenase [Rhodococcus jostii]|uniref:Dihydrolipoyl dehydrogenase n=1 Tax=Rhodococcus jostii TaxID=132919 RepID=A0A1H4IRJ0_RHOJO|nr:dihydrolipoyl dehydrogenase [Rhodococcus jostii]SEB36680.1 dihydrolipoamide dehydrogenase [Rhodococcus jostii]